MLNVKESHGVMPHQLARVSYWLSLLLLVAGMYVLIDPLHRQRRETVHVYITLGAFELYIWLLLCLGRWQRRRLRRLRFRRERFCWRWRG